MMTMTEKTIRLSDTDEVMDFVRAAGKCDFDIDVFYKRAVIDAKSILGMIGIAQKEEIVVKYFGNNVGFESVVDKYAIA